MHAKNTALLSAIIDRDDYQREALVSIKTPLSLPYYSNTEAFERVDGIIEVEGTYYHYVKRRVFNDSLELLCLPNPEKAKLDKVASEFSKVGASETGSTQNTKKAPVVKILLPEFCENGFINMGIPNLRLVAINHSSFTINVSEGYIAIHTPPPNVMHGFICV